MLTEVNRSKYLLKYLLMVCFCLTSSLSLAQNKQKGKRPKAKAKSVGPAVGGNTATPVELIKAAKGFKKPGDVKHHIDKVYRGWGEVAATEVAISCSIPSRD